LGSTRALTDINGLLTDAYAYEAFGEMIKQLGNTQNSYLFAGEQRDPNLALDYLRARYLDVNSGRFYGRDIFEGTQDSPITFNKYLYAESNSINNIDPSGNITLREISALFAVWDVATFIINPTPLNFASIVAGRLAPAKYVKGLEKIFGSDLGGRLGFLGHSLATGPGKFTEPFVKNLLQSKYGARIFLNDEGLSVIFRGVGKGGRRVDWVGDLPSGKLIYGEAKSSPSYQKIEETIEKFKNSIDTLKGIYTAGGNVYPGTGKLLIGLESLHYLNGFKRAGQAAFSVKNGVLMRGGGPVIVVGQKIFVEIL
jgi:RHS repeat-associated protein